MLTIKVHHYYVETESCSNRNESIFSATGIHTEISQVDGKEQIYVHIHMQDNSFKSYCVDSQTVIYVENSNGKTVQVFSEGKQLRVKKSA